MLLALLNLQRMVVLCGVAITMQMDKDKDDNQMYRSCHLALMSNRTLMDMINIISIDKLGLADEVSCRKRRVEGSREHSTRKRCMIKYDQESMYQCIFDDCLHFGIINLRGLRKGFSSSYCKNSRTTILFGPPRLIVVVDCPFVPRRSFFFLS